jgi:hypothetical protein
VSFPSSDRRKPSSRTERVSDEDGTIHPASCPGGNPALDEARTLHSGETCPPRTGPAPGLTDVPPSLANHPRYCVLGLLGSGGMGSVYRAEHRLMQRTIALKVINPSLTSGPEAVERFRREVVAAARLMHPNIVAAYDAEQAGDLHFLAMELVEGMSLSELLERQGRLSVADACSYVRQAALGLQHAFEKGMVHRDIKPHNLMLTPEGQVKVLDFGLARFVSETTQAGGLTQAGMVMGTPDYMAPEQARDARAADIRADIYSLGCTLYSLLTGERPFPDGDYIQKVMAHLEQEPRPVSTFRQDVPPELVRVLGRMLAKDPAQRYQTPLEVAEALAPFTKPATAAGKEQTLVGAAPAGAAAPGSRRGAWVVAVLVFLVVVVAGVSIAVALHRPGPAEEGAVVPVPPPETAKVIVAPPTVRATSRPAATAPEGKNLAPALRPADALVRYDFGKSRNGWPLGVNRIGVERGWAHGAYYLRATKRTNVFEHHGDHFPSFACEVVGRIKEGPCGWGLALIHWPREEKREGLWLTINRRGLHIQVLGVDADQVEGAQAETVTSPALKRAMEFNRLLVVFRDGRLQPYVNGEAVGGPVTVPASLSPALVTLCGRFGPRGGEVEFQRMTIWSADNLPAPARTRRGKEGR